MESSNGPKLRSSARQNMFFLFYIVIGIFLIGSVFLDNQAVAAGITITGVIILLVLGFWSSVRTKRR